MKTIIINDENINEKFTKKKLKSRLRLKKLEKMVTIFLISINQD